MIPKVFKLGIGDILEVLCIWGLKGQKINKSILPPRTAIHRHSLCGVTSRWQDGIELYEYLLVPKINKMYIVYVCFTSIVIDVF